MLKFKKLSSSAFAPNKSSIESAGIDLQSAYSYLVPGRGKQLIKTDLAIQLPPGTYGRIAPRSGLALDFHITIGGGVIDPDYRGNVCIILFNHDVRTFRVTRGDKVAQLICEKYFCPTTISECENLGETERGDRGFGSSGVSNMEMGEEPTPSTSGHSFTSTPPPPSPTDNTASTTKETSTSMATVMTEEADTATTTTTTTKETSTSTATVTIETETEPGDTWAAKQAAKITSYFRTLEPRAELEFIVDAVGFFPDGYAVGSFVVKEYAFACVQSDRVTENFFIDPPYPFNQLSERKQEVVLAKTRHLHGLEWNLGGITGEELYALLRIKIPREADIYADGEFKCEIFSKLLDKPVRNLRSVYVPDASCIKYDLENFIPCSRPEHQLLSNSGGLKFQCALARVQKFRSWYRKRLINCASLPNHITGKVLKQMEEDVIFPRRSIRRRGIFCCYFKCQDRLDGTTEVDGLACHKCGAYSRCLCKCPTHMYSVLSHF